jgi:DNA-binding SARP family transcriptional activator/WD40 repeat protein
MADALAAGGAAVSDRVPPGVRVSLLGPMQVELGPQPLHVAGPQRRRLLAVLACRAGRVVPVEALIDAMWGDDPPPTAAKTLQSHVVRLRQSLAGAGEAIETGPGGYRLAVEPDAVDVARFESLADQGASELRNGHAATAERLLEAADALWRGPALMEFADDDFALGDRARLEERRLVAHEDLAEARLTSSPAAVVADMERSVAVTPARERSWALLMRGLYASGRQREALAAFQRARNVLGEEFGLEPGPELRELEQRIIAQDPTLTVARRASPPAPLRAESPLVGRDDEVAWLRSAWTRAAAGVGQVRVIRGANGSGRTRLIAEVATTAYEDGASVEYVSGATGLHALGAAAAPGAVVDEIASRCREAPLLLVVDDVQWTPPASIDAIRAVTLAAERLSLMLVIIGHDGEGPGIDLVRELDRTCASTLHLAGLPDRAIAEILLRDGIETEAIDAVVALADGLPGLARREAAAWAERAAAERLSAAAAVSVGAQSAAAVAGASVRDEVTRLVESRGRRAALAASDLAGRQPYRSLTPYEPADADLFVGRERLVAELTARAIDRRLVAVIGPSGSGKSSIGRAGLLPLVRSGRLPGGVAWRAEVIVPGDDPLAAIDAATVHDDPGPRLLVIDQFEEVLATGQIDAVAARLLDLLFDPALDSRVVVVIRADQLGAIASSRAMAEMFEDAQMLIGPPSTEELRRIVIEPARRTGCTVEPELVSMVIGDVAGHEAALPLVSAAMAEVWAQREDATLTAATYIEIGGLAAAVERLGDRALAAVGPAGHARLRDVMLRLVDVADDGAWVRRRVDTSDLPRESTPALDALVGARLVAVADGQVDVVHEVVFRAWPQMVEWLEEARADLVLERDLRASARAWDAQCRSDDDVLRGARLHAAADWSARADHPTAVVTQYIAASRDAAERDELALRYQLRKEQRGRRRLRSALAVASVLLLVAVSGGVLAVRTSRQAERERDRADVAATEAGAAAEEADRSAQQAAAAADVAEARRAEADELRVVAEQQEADAQLASLVLESGTNRDRNLALALLLAVEAHATADSAATRGALLDALTHNMTPGPARPGACCLTFDLPRVKSSFAGFISGPDRMTTAITLSADGGRIATVGVAEDEVGGEVFVFDSERRELVARLPTSETTAGISMAPDGSQLLIADGEVTAYSIETGELATVDPATLDGEVARDAFFTRDGGQFVVKSFADDSPTANLRLFDAATLTPVDVELPGSPVGLAGLASDGTLAIAGAAETAGATTPVTFWDIATNTSVRTVELEVADGGLSQFVFSADMRWLAGSEFQGRVFVWDLEDGRLVGDPSTRPQSTRPIAFDPAEPSILVVGSADASVTMHDVASGQQIGDPLRGQPGGSRTLGFSGDGRLLATTSDDGTIGLWSDKSGPSLLSRPLDEEHRLFDASADGNVVVVGDRHTARIRRLDSPDAPDVVLTPPLDVSEQVAWDISADGDRVLGAAWVEAEPGTWVFHLRMHDTRTGEVVWSDVRDDMSYLPALSPDGAVLAWPAADVESGQPFERVVVFDVPSDSVVGSYEIGDAFPGLDPFLSATPRVIGDASTSPLPPRSAWRCSIATAASNPSSSTTPACSRARSPSSTTDPSSRAATEEVCGRPTSPRTRCAEDDHSARRA